MDDKLYLVGVNSDGELEYVGLDGEKVKTDGERVVICGMKDVRYEESHISNVFSFEKGKNSSVYTKEYCEKSNGDIPVYSGKTENQGIFGKIKEDDFTVDTKGVLFFTTVGNHAMEAQILRGKFNLSQNCAIGITNEKKYFINFLYFTVSNLFNSYMQGKDGGRESFTFTSIKTDYKKEEQFFTIPIPSYQATKEKSPTTDFSKIEKHLTDKDENSKLDDLMSYQLQMSIAKYIEDYNGSIDDQIGIIDKMIVVNEFKKEKFIDEIFDKESSISGESLYEVELVNGELEYILGDDGEKILICWMKDVGYEKEKVDLFFVFSGSKTEYKSDYFNNNIGDFPIYTGSLNVAANIFPKNKEDIENFPSLSYNKDNDTGSTVFFHKSPYIVGGHHYSMFFKNEKKELNSYNYFYLLFLNHFQKVHYYQSQKPVANVGTIKQLKFPIPSYRATKEKSPTTDFSKIEKHLTDKNENAKLNDLISYKLQMSIAKYIEDYDGNIDGQNEILEKMKVVLETKKEILIKGILTYSEM